MRLNTAILAFLEWPCDKLDKFWAWLEAGRDAKPNPLEKRCYLMSESHLSGYRLVIGFETLEDVQSAHEFLARSAGHNA